MGTIKPPEMRLPSPQEVFKNRQEHHLFGTDRKTEGQTVVQTVIGLLLKAVGLLWSGGGGETSPGES